MNTIRSISLALVVILLPTAAWSDSSVSIVANHDNTIFQNSTGVNNSAGGLFAILVGNNNMGMGSPRRGLISFDIAGNIPSGSTITDAQLTLYLGDAPGSAGGQVIELRPLSKAWGEGTQGDAATMFSGIGNGFPAATNDATWNQNFFSATSWTTPGGDYGAASATIASGTTVGNGYSLTSTAAAIADVQSWLDNPTTNYGWLLRNSTEAGTQTVRGFYSRSASEPLLRPTLNVTFVPEPTTAVMLFFVSAVVVLIRRRQTPGIR